MEFVIKISSSKSEPILGLKLDEGSILELFLPQFSSCKRDKQKQVKSDLKKAAFLAPNGPLLAHVNAALRGVYMS